MGVILTIVSGIVGVLLMLSVDVLGLTHEQLLQLRDMIKASGAGKQGKSRAVEKNASALLHIHQYQQLGASFTSAVNAAACAEICSTTTLYNASHEFHTTSSLTPPDTSERGRGNPDHPLHPLNTKDYGPTLQAELLMHEKLEQQKIKDTRVTSVTLKADLRETLGISVHEVTIQRWLHQLSYEWRHKRYVGGMKPQARNARLRQFILEYAAALSEQDKGNAVIVYTDESFIHTTHSFKKGWFHPQRRDVLANDSGKRLIILHAMTMDGLLADEDAVSTNWLSEVALTCEVVFEEIYEDGKDTSNYHNTMNGIKFVAWLRNRLLPTFSSLHPGKKMFLVLDNANYHKPRDESWVSATSAMNKHELAHQLLDLGVPSLVNSCGGTIPSHLFTAAVSDGGPSKKDLIAASKRWLDERPDHNKTVVEQLMSDAGHSLVYTPPFCPEVQPIELLWAAVKRRVAAQSTTGRSLTATRTQTEDAFEEITLEFCQRIVRHCHDWIDQFLETDGAEDLAQCGNLAGVANSLPLLKAASITTSSTTSAASNGAAPMEISSPLPPIPAATAASSSSGRVLRPRH